MRTFEVVGRWLFRVEDYVEQKQAYRGEDDVVAGQQLDVDRDERVRNLLT